MESSGERRLRRRRATGPLAALALVAGVPAVLAAAGDASGAHAVVIQGLQYAPETIKVKRGDVVVWTNKDPFPHTVTAAGAFDSKSLGEGKSFRYKADRTGTFTYICTLHSNMKGVLQVE